MAIFLWSRRAIAKLAVGQLAGGNAKAPNAKNPCVAWDIICDQVTLHSGVRLNTATVARIRAQI